MRHGHGWTKQKRRYRQYKARTAASATITAIDAMERYLEFFGPGKKDSCCRCWRTVDLFEQSAANGTSPRSSGRSPRSSPSVSSELPEGQWISRERERLTNAIDRVADNAP